MLPETPGSKLRRARRARGLSQPKLGAKIAPLTGSTPEAERGRINAYEREIVTANLEKYNYRAWFKFAAEALEVPFDWFLEPRQAEVPYAPSATHVLTIGEEQFPYGKVKVPLLGEVTAGPFTEASEAIGEEAFDASLVTGAGKVFCLRAVDDSMLDDVQPGDILLVKRASVARPNVLTVAEDQEHKTTLKAARMQPDGTFKLEAKNPPGLTLRAHSITILGIVIGIRRYTGGGSYMEFGDPTGIRV